MTLPAIYNYKQLDDAVKCYTRWNHSPSLTKVTNCRVVNLIGEPRVTVFVIGKPDMYFSIPAKFHYLGKVLNGYLTGDDDGNLVCHHCYY